jgi:hypothetical protein
LIVPDFIGMEPDEAVKSLEAQLPHFTYCFRTYAPPAERKDRDADVVYRIIRQKLISDNRLEFIISPFYAMIE